MKSLFFQRRISWLEIVDFFPVGNNEIGHNEYVVICRNGEQFFLSVELSESEKLFELIRKRIQAAPSSFEHTYYVGDGVFDMPFLASWAIMVALLTSAATCLQRPHTPNELLIDVGGPLLLSVLPAFFWWLSANKVPQLLRAGKSELYVRTRSKAFTIPWEQITRITKIGPWMLIKSGMEWFVMLAPKEEPIVMKLLACKEKLLSVR